MEATTPPDSPIETKSAIPEGKVYTEKEIWSAALLGGPLSAAYLFASNYKLFGETDKVRKVWIWSVIATLALFGMIFLIPKEIGDKIPNMVFPFIQAIIVQFLVNLYQKEKINVHINAGGKKYNWGRTILISLIGCIITLIPIILFVFIVTPKAPSALSIKYDSTKTYNTTGNEIFYKKKYFADTVINRLATELQREGLFDDKKKVTVAVDKIDTTYQIDFFCSPVIKDENFDFSSFYAIRLDIQQHFLHNKIELDLYDSESNSIVKTITSK